VLLDDLDQSDDLVARDPVGELRMVAPEMLQREIDDLILGLAADDLAALACDLPGHGLVSRAIVGSRPFAYVGGKVGARLERADNTYVQLCGRFVVELHGRRVEQRFPSRQGRVLFAYLVLQRPREVGRHELIEAIWAGDLSANHASALTVLLSKLRAAVGADVLAGRGSVRVALPPDARVDVEQALAALHRAESAVVQGDWARAWSAALCARYVTARPLLPDHDDLPWLDLWRRRLDDALDSALEAYAAACLGLGGTEVAGAERAARRLLEHNPLRETGYRLLMQALAARGNVAEALHVYERARTVLRDELGIPPGPAIHEIHAALLGRHG
jgi:DNA-binding SARP family transcriptional activator